MASTLETPPPARMAFACLPNWSRTPAPGCSGPQRPDNWRLGGKPAQKAFAAVASAIARFEPVTMGVNPAQFANARQMLPPQVRVVELPNNDAWMRDCGPTFVVNGRGEVRRWTGSSMPGADCSTDCTSPGIWTTWWRRKWLRLERVDRYSAPLVLEGGSIHVDGEGTCLTTAECLLSPGRNPELDPSTDRSPSAGLPERRKGAVDPARRLS